ncbi:hypothetical protein GcC1_194024 [Golovinomyces cichoracearum]|uniref:Uncharacterized protein n=1 Tax=Golovinomyces cichoracearum TaxID=62708 RepID=A0A420HH04_9PEZI|nr:hypothetical protein GcC1_194024 [Golovinomyces cichoracearum]
MPLYDLLGGLEPQNAQTELVEPAELVAWLVLVAQSDSVNCFHYFEFETVGITTYLITSYNKPRLPLAVLLIA